MKKTKIEEKNLKIKEIPLRQELPIGTFFRFIGKRNVYQVVEDKETQCTFLPDCSDCFFHDSKRKLECGTIFCSRGARQDNKNVVIKKIK